MIGSACDWRDEIIIGNPLALAADVHTWSPSTNLNWSDLRTWWIRSYSFSSILPPPFLGDTLYAYLMHQIFYLRFHDGRII